MIKTQNPFTRIFYLLFSLLLLALGITGINNLKHRPALPIKWITIDNKLTIDSINTKYESWDKSINIGDILISIDGRPIEDIREIEFLVDAKKSGESLEIELLRESKTFTVTLILSSKWNRRFLFVYLFLGISFWSVGKFI